MEKTAVRAFIKALGITGYILMTVFAVMFALIALVACVSIFTSNIIIGLFGTAGAGACASICWANRKEVLS